MLKRFFEHANKCLVSEPDHLQQRLLMESISKENATSVC